VSCVKKKIEVNKKTMSDSPEFVQYLKKLFVKGKPFKLRDDLEKIWETCLYIDKKLSTKLDKRPEEKAKFELIKQEFLDLYVETTAKEKELEEKGDYKTKEWGYRIKVPNKRDQHLWEKLKRKRIRGY